MTRSILSVLFVIGGFVASSACASQSEGERCDTNSGSDDCETGLVCTPASQLAVGAKQNNATWGLCCPVDKTRQPVEACFAASSTPGAGGSAGTGGTDAGSSTGGAVETGGTAPIDASNDTSKGGG
jgi:hypothetical protein